MKFFDKKSQMLYKNEFGGRIMVRITLPRADSQCELNTLYDAVTEKYLIAAKEFINKTEDAAVCFFDVCYEREDIRKYIKIKRVSMLKLGGKTVKATVLKDYFQKESLKLKK